MSTDRLQAAVVAVPRRTAGLPPTNEHSARISSPRSVTGAGTAVGADHHLDPFAAATMDSAAERACTTHMFVLQPLSALRLPPPPRTSRAA